MNAKTLAKEAIEKSLRGPAEEGWALLFADVVQAIEFAVNQERIACERVAMNVANEISRNNHKACRWPSAFASLGVAEEIAATINLRGKQN